MGTRGQFDAGDEDHAEETSSLQPAVQAIQAMFRHRPARVYTPSDAEIEQVLRETMRLDDIRYYIEEAMASLRAPVHTDAAGRALTLLAEAKKLLAESAPPKGDVAAPPAKCPSCKAMSSVQAETLCNATEMCPGAGPDCPMEPFDRWPTQVEFDAYEARQIELADAQCAEAPAVAPSDDEAYTQAEDPDSRIPHNPTVCRSRYCAQHRDIWRHYEDVIAKAEPVAPPTLRDGWLQRQFDALKPFLCLRCGVTFNSEHSCPQLWVSSNAQGQPQPNGEYVALEQSAPPPDVERLIKHFAERIGKNKVLCSQVYSETWRVEKFDEYLREFLQAVKSAYLNVVQGEQASYVSYLDCDGPTCTVCGSNMIAFDANGTSLGTNPDPRIICEYRCLSCKSTTGCTGGEQASPTIPATIIFKAFYATDVSDGVCAICGHFCPNVGQITLPSSHHGSCAVLTALAGQPSAESPAPKRRSDYCRDCRQPVTGSVHVEMVTGQKICFRCFKRMEEPQPDSGPAQTESPTQKKEPR